MSGKVACLVQFGKLVWTPFWTMPFHYLKLLKMGDLSVHVLSVIAPQAEMG